MGHSFASYASKSASSTSSWSPSAPRSPRALRGDLRPCEWTRCPSDVPLVLPQSVDAVVFGVRRRISRRQSAAVNRMQPRVIVAPGGFEPNTFSVESLGLRRSAARPWKPPHRPLEGVPTLKRHLFFGKPHKACGSQSRHAGSIFAERVEKLRHAAPMALKILPDCPEFYNAPNEIKGSNQTTNLGGRSSNLFGRATVRFRCCCRAFANIA
jgi:hypothetical protein